MRRLSRYDVVALMLLILLLCYVVALILLVFQLYNWVVVPRQSAAIEISSCPAGMFMTQPDATGFWCADPFTKQRKHVQFHW